MCKNQRSIEPASRSVQDGVDAFYSLFSVVFASNVRQARNPVCFSGNRSGFSEFVRTRV